MQFVDRAWEIKFLNDKYRSNQAQLIIVYGKRRVGKTTLIKEFSQQKPSIYFLAEKTSEHDQLRELSERIGEFFKDTFLRERGFENWLQVFKYLKDKNKRVIFTVDEFPYLVEANKAMPSIFQKGWDEHLKNSRIFMILSGSSIAMMESEVLGYKAPLYGRRTGQILVEPMKFEDIHDFFPKKSFDDRVAIYSILGGIPAYLVQFSPDEGVWENVRKKILSKGEILYEEPEFILREELREPRNYFSILRAISLGKTRLGEIMNETGFEKAMVNKYLSVLKSLRVVQREVPVTEDKPDKSKKGIYVIDEPFMRFWFAFVLPNRSYVELGNEKQALENIKRGFTAHQALVYEKIAREVLERTKKTKLPISFTKVGRYWDKNIEIDAVGLNEETKEILFAEVKWRKEPVGVGVLEDLKRKAQAVDRLKGKRNEYFAIFSRSGFTEALKRQAKETDVFLFNKDRVEA